MISCKTCGKEAVTTGDDLVLCTDMACVSNAGFVAWGNANLGYDGWLETMNSGELATLQHAYAAGRAEQSMVGRAKAARADRTVPQGIILSSLGRGHALDTDITMPDGTPVGFMVARAEMVIEPGQLNRLNLELVGAQVLAKVLDYRMVLDMEAHVHVLRKVLGSVAAAGGDISDVGHHLNALYAKLEVAKTLLRTPKQVLHGKTLYQWCQQMGITDEATIHQAEDINETEPHGLRVFPDGNAWMAIPPEYKGGPQQQVAFDSTPDKAIAAWLAEYGECGAGHDWERIPNSDQADRCKRCGLVSGK